MKLCPNSSGIDRLAKIMPLSFGFRRVGGARKTD
jgi:hypothetical protein